MSDALKTVFLFVLLIITLCLLLVAAFAMMDGAWVRFGISFVVIVVLLAIIGILVD